MPTASEAIASLQAMCATAEEQVILDRYLAACRAGDVCAHALLDEFLQRVQLRDPAVMVAWLKSLGEPEWARYSWRGAADGHYADCPKSGVPRDKLPVAEPGSDGAECICDLLWPYYLVREDSDDWEPPDIWHGRAQIPAKELCGLASCGHKACHPCWLATKETR